MIDPRRDMLLLCPTCNEFRTFRWDYATSIGICSTCGRDNLGGGGTPSAARQAGQPTSSSAELLVQLRAAARQGAEYPAVLRYWAERVDTAQRAGTDVPYDNAAIRAACAVLRGAK